MTRKKKRNELSRVTRLNRVLDKIIDILESACTPSDPLGQSIEDCIAVLGTILGIIVGNPLYIFETLMFSNQTHW